MQEHDEDKSFTIGSGQTATDINAQTVTDINSSSLGEVPQSWALFSFLQWEKCSYRLAVTA